VLGGPRARAGWKIPLNQALSQRLARTRVRGDLWDPVGQGERSQFWDATTGKSRYNLICRRTRGDGEPGLFDRSEFARWENMGWDSRGRLSANRAKLTVSESASP